MKKELIEGRKEGRKGGVIELDGYEEKKRREEKSPFRKVDGKGMNGVQGDFFIDMFLLCFY